MAGLGRKVFSPGEVLTATNVQNYLMDQAVQVYAGTAARGSAIGSATTEGMVSWLADTNQLQVATGTAAWADVSFGQSENFVINGGFDIWQRGTSFTSTLGAVRANTADRWNANAPVSGNTVSRQPTSDTTNLPDITYCLRFSRNSGNTDTTTRYLVHMLESSQGSLLTGKQVTLSFYARKGADYSPASSLLLAEVRGSSGTIDGNIFGTFTSPSNPVSQNVTLTTSWQKFSITGVIASSVTQLAVVFVHNTVGTAGANDYYEITGVQLERGSVATSFRRNAPSIQSELAACQRFFHRLPTGVKGLGTYYSASDCYVISQMPVTMRANGTPSISPGFAASDFRIESGASTRTATALAFAMDNPNFARIQVTTSAATAGAGGWLIGAGTIDVSAEL
jgi:hypothetical protein